MNYNTFQQPAQSSNDLSDPHPSLQGYVYGVPNNRGERLAYPVPQIHAPRIYRPAAPFMTVSASFPQNVVTPRSSNERRYGIDMRACGKVKSDWWHHELPSFFVNPNPDPSSVAVRFFPDDGRGQGVALSECIYNGGMVDLMTPVASFLPANWAHIQGINLVLMWPGYSHLSYNVNISFVKPDGRPLHIGAVAGQVAGMVKTFIAEYGALFDRNNPDTVKLGPQNVSFDDIRLHQIFPVNNLIWTVELSYVVKK